MSLTTLYLIRHGETDYNRRRIMQGRRINSQLNDTGRRQAEAVARRLADVSFDAAYASSLRRAIETAEIITADRPGLPIRQLPDLDEMSWGIHEGEPWSAQLESSLAAMRARWDQRDFAHRVEEGESILDVQERGLRAIEEIVHRHPGETVLVVTHGRFLRVLLASLLDAYGLERMDEIEHANTGVNRLVVEEGRFSAELLNCTAHLDDAGALLVE